MGKEFNIDLIIIGILMLVVGLLIGISLRPNDNDIKYTPEQEANIMVKTILDIHELNVGPVSLNENMTLVDIRNMYNSYNTYPSFDSLVYVGLQQICREVS